MPIVSIIVPCYNEEHTIRLLLEALYQQTYPRQEMEVIVADGMSVDATRLEIQAFQQAHPDLAVRIVDNIRRNIPAGLNRALEAAQGEWIVRLDGHSAPQPDYVAACVQALQAGRGENVGGRWEIRPRRDDWQARAIAIAASHPLGVGDAQYRFTEQAQWVDTVPFGAFAAALVRKIGPFDESLLTNEDYEFNARIRQAGGRVWLDPAIRSIYYAAPDLGALARQYARYGFWKARMLRRYPSTLRWRQGLPPAFVVGLAGLAVLSLFFPWARWLLLGVVAVYGTVLLAVSLQLVIKHKDPALLVGVPLAVAVMHLAWGGAFVGSFLKSDDRSKTG